jgi:hypothetical protein
VACDLDPLPSSGAVQTQLNGIWNLLGCSIVCEIVYQKLATAREEEMAREKHFGGRIRKKSPGSFDNFGVRLHDVTARTTHLHVKVSLYRLLQFRVFSEMLLTTQPPLKPLAL